MQNTDIVMLDEPFSNLDSELRRRLREETLILLRKHHKTVVLVTHDPTEAFLSAEKIIYLKEGCQIQMGTPQEIYYHPKNLDIALFSGNMNIFTVVIKDNIAQTVIGNIPISSNYKDGHATLAIRYEGFILSELKGCALITAKIIRKEFAGRYYRLVLSCRETEFIAEMSNDDIKNIPVGDIIGLSIKKEMMFIF
jgi:iron(III) transport system ATP-binding protein